jgi:PAS domain S-box-containing protein
MSPARGLQTDMAPSSEASPRTYKLLLAAVIVVPTALAAGFAWWNWERVTDGTVVRMDQRVDMLYENALRLLQTDQQLLDRIDDRVARLSWPEIVARRPELESALARITAGVPEVKGASLVDPQGNVAVVMSRRSTAAVAGASVRDRDYFERAQTTAGLIFDGPFKGRVSGELSDIVVQRLSSPDGSFRGLAVLIVDPNEIAGYWRSLVEPGDAVNLVGDDGAILARWPEPITDQRQRVSALALRMRQSAERGQFEQPKSVFDGVARRVAFRKLSPFPLSVSYAIDRENLLNEWYPMTLAFLGFAGLAAVALFVIARTVVRSAVALRESEARYRALYDKTPVPLHACDIDGNIIAVSDRWLDLMGYTREEVIGRPVADFRTPEQAVAFRNGGWKKSVEAGGVRDVERKYRRKSGELLDVMISSRAEYDSAGRFRRMAVVVIDVTEKKRIESTLYQVQKMEAVGQLTGGVAHDFNNLLTVIGGNLDMLRLRLKSGDSDLLRLVDGALRGAKRASTLTQRLLAFSRRQPLDPKPINPNRLVSGMSEMLGRTLGETIAIETVLGGGAWWVEVDENQLENTLLNLAVNARDAMPNGGKLTIETANTYLDESYALANEDVISGQYVMIAVSDTGTGMSGEVIAKAFEPFFTTKTTGHGTGLGLSQVYGFIKQSGGHVKIYSEVGHGTTIKLYLPRLASVDIPDLAAEPPRAAAALSGKTILVVEDDDDVRAFAADILTELGHRVLAAADGAAALRLVEDNPDIDLLFTDVGLPPPHNGRTLSEAILKLRPGLRVLFTTGYARNAIVHHGRLDAGVDLIVKPYTQADLAAKITGVLEGEPAGLRVPSDAADGPARAGL